MVYTLHAGHKAQPCGSVFIFFATARLYLVVNILYLELACGSWGYTPPSNFDDNGNLNLTVNLNKDKLPNYSQEYIATVIIHESLHAYLTTTNNLGTWQHWNIATTFATQMSVDLQQMFPNLQGPDATNLSWSGLETTDAFQQSIGNNLTAQGHYVATLLAYPRCRKRPRLWTAFRLNRQIAKCRDLHDAHKQGPPFGTSMQRRQSVGVLVTFLGR